MIIFALTLAVQQPADREPELWALVGQASRLLGECIVDNAQKLEPSGETADTVAEAAVGECRKERELAHRAIAMHTMINRDLSEGRASATADRALSTWEADYRSQAVREVVRIRAARNYAN